MDNSIQIHERARQMARSGRFCSWRLIAIELRFIEGVREADYGFASTAFRAELDELCRVAQKAACRPSDPGAETAGGGATPRPSATHAPAPRWIPKYRT